MTKVRAAANAFLAYLEPRECIWQLQMSFPSNDGRLQHYPNPLAGFQGPLHEGGKTEEGGTNGGGKGKTERDGKDGKITPKKNCWLQP